MNAGFSGRSMNSPKQSKKSKTRTVYPDPLVISPSIEHSHTFIILHGRGSNASRFGLKFLESAVTSGKNLQQLYPGMKFIFPTAKKRRSAIFKRTPINQWFDNWSLDDPSEREELQVDGVRETGLFIHGLLRAEAETVPLKNILIGGLSQGCAMALHVLLSFTSTLGEFEALGGFIGMSGWLPLRNSLEEIIHPDDNDADDDPFSHRSDDGQDGQSIAVRVINSVRDNMNLPPVSNASCLLTPAFLVHGSADKKVSVKLGEQAAATLRDVGIDVRWKAYKEFSHWYKVPDEIEDIVRFLSEKVGIRAEGDEGKGS